MNRAYSLLTVKAVDEDLRIIRGVATTPSVDRVGDIIEPLGVKFKNPMPLLLHHRHDSPVGTVRFDKPTADGITFEATLPKIDEPGTLKDRVDEAWQSVKLKLIRAVSIGFRAIAPTDETIERIKNGGLRFLKTEVLELSLVAIPANQDATIATVKSLDTDLRAALGHNRSGVVRLSPGASGKSSSTKSAPEGKMKTFAEQIKEWEATRAAKIAKRDEILAKSAESGETPDDAQQQELDEIKSSVVKIDKHLSNLRDAEKDAKAAAKPVIGDDPDGAGNSRDPAPRIQVIEPKLEKGTAFIRYVLCRAEAKADGGGLEAALTIAKQRYPEYAPLHRLLKATASYGGISLAKMRKAQEYFDFTKAVAAGTTSNADWATELVNYTILASDFIEYLRPQTIVGKFGTGGIPGLNRVPFNVKIPRQTTKGTGYWTGEGKPKYLTKFNTDMVTLDFHKIATIAAITKELARFSNPQAETLVRNELARAVIERADIDFIDPNKAASANVSPASVLNGVTALTSATTTGTVAEVITDIQSILSEFIQENIPVASMVWIMNQNVALALSLLQTSLGNQAFPGITMNGGTFQGIPVITSQYVPAQLLILVSAEDILLADDGNVSIDVSDQASLEMLDSGSSQDGTTGTGVSMVSMFQTNMLAIRAEREITWLKRRTGAAQYMTGFNPGGTAGSGDI